MDKLGSLVMSSGAGALMMIEHYWISALLMVVAIMWVSNPASLFGDKHE